MKALLLRNFDGKMTIGKKIAGIILVFFPVLVYAQSDSLFSFSEKQFLQAVRQFHPIVKQSNNKLEMAKAGIVAARAGFDPQFLHEMDEKKLGGDWYYQMQHQELILPTWYGIDFTAGRESIVGPRYNPENSLGDYSYLSVKIPLLKDLVMDKRRAALKQSKIFLQQSEQEQKNMVNDLMNDAFQTYWNWKRSYQQWLISKSVNENNRLRFEFVKQEYLQGFRAAIDTLEALIQWQQWQSHQIESELLFKNANVELSAFLWDQNAQPYQLPDKTIPDKLTMGTNEMPIPVLEELMLYVENSHPKLMTYKFKSTSLELDRLLKKQELLPKLNLKAQLLQKGNPTLAPVFQWQAWQNNHKFGLDFVLPLRLSAARGAYRQANIKISDNLLETAQMKRALQNKVQSYFNEYLSFKSQLGIYENSVQGYEKLYLGEWTRFQAGESSLFLLNSREMKWMEAQQKLVDLEYKCNKSFTAILWSAGSLQ